MENAPVELIELVSQFDQPHLLAFWDELSEEQREQLQREIRSIDFKQLGELFHGDTTTIDWGDLARRALPPFAIPLSDFSSHQQAKVVGEDRLRAGKVAMILVAGGQGTRLGFDKPKGMFRIGPVSQRTLFAMHIDSLLGAMKKYNAEIPLFIMTSPATDAETRNYFEENANHGMPASLLQIFCQGTMPAIDRNTGKVLLESKGKIAMSPDGHGGIVAALDRNGILEKCARAGIEHLFYAQVDNPLVRACDPTLIGHHLIHGSQMTTQVVRKRFAKEKVGNVVSIDGRTQIIEYSDLPDREAEAVTKDGSLKLWAGNIAVHVMERSFLESAVRSEDALPFHQAFKQVPCVNERGEMVRSATPNGIKFERFVFDLLPNAEKAIVVEGDPAEVFAPVKNADGAATDTPSITKEMISALHKGWLKKAGIDCSANKFVEINPLWAFDAEDVVNKGLAPTRIEVDTYFV